MSMITEQIKRLRSEAAGMILQNGTTARLLREAAETIEQLAAKVREDNVYQKAFEDIKEELYKERTNISFNLSEEKAKWTNSGIYDGLVWAEEIIDKHNPDKGKERE